MSTSLRRPLPNGRLAQLSRRAVEYGAALALDDPRELADRLYRYNSMPAGGERGGFAERWTGGREGLRVESRRDGIWEVRDASDAPPLQGPMYKLYVSPVPADTARAFDVLLSELGAPDGPFSAKAALEPPARIRPDRIVGYFATRRACFATARRIAPRLAGMAAQGVPFTAALGRSGLLSWGADPPPAVAQTLPEHEQSWRRWVSARLAEAILAERGISSSAASAAPADTALAALARLHAAGVPPDWTPPWR